MGTLGTAGMRLDFDAGVDSDEYGPPIVVVKCRGPFQGECLEAASPKRLFVIT